MTPTYQSFNPSLKKRPPEGDTGAMLSTATRSSSQHPHDWGRALACAVSSLVEQILDTTGMDPCCEQGGLDLTLNINTLPGGAEITVTWLPIPTVTEDSAARPPSMS